MTKITNWWVWERPASTHIIYTAASTCAHAVKKVYGYAYSKTFYGFFKKGMVRWMCDMDELVANGKEVIALMKDPDYYKEKKAHWTKLTDELNQLFATLDETGLSELSDPELLELYNKLDRLYSDWWGATQVAELVSYGGEDMLKKRLTPEQFKKYFSLLVSPTKPSYTYEEETKIYEIVKQAQEKGIDHANVQAMLEKHAEEYHWMQNNFHDTTVLDAEHFKEKVAAFLKDNVDVEKLREDEEQRLAKVTEDKKAAVEELGLQDLQHVITLIDEFCTIQDDRKMMALKGCYHIDRFSKEVAQRKKIPYELIAFATPDQVRGIIQDNKVSLETLAAQKEHLVIIFNDEDYSAETFIRGEAVQKEREILGDQQEARNVTEIEGMAACGGRAQGKVRVIVSPKDIDKMQEGEILVSTMTSPDFVVAMKKAAAIITDEGGVTSHAAIVSRELGIPCVIGTKNATRILEDGMTVEVRANHGLVKIVI